MRWEVAAVLPIQVTVSTRTIIKWAGIDDSVASIPLARNTMVSFATSIRVSGITVTSVKMGGITVTRFKPIVVHPRDPTTGLVARKITGRACNKFFMHTGEW